MNALELVEGLQVTLLRWGSATWDAGGGEWHSLGFNNCHELPAVLPDYSEGVKRGPPVYQDWLDDDGDGLAGETDQ